MSLSLSPFAQSWIFDGPDANRGPPGVSRFRLALRGDARICWTGLGRCGILRARRRRERRRPATKTQAILRMTETRETKRSSAGGFVLPKKGLIPIVAVVVTIFSPAERG